MAYLLDRCKAMIIVINSLHSEGIDNMDLKDANIFVRDTVWFVGDFGSFLNFGNRKQHNRLLPAHKPGTLWQACKLAS